MSGQITTQVFLMQRLGVTLLVMYRSSGLVKIEPFSCKSENLRLWTGIATTQAVLAQMQLSLNKGQQPVTVLANVFRKGGWNLTAVDESALEDHRNAAPDARSLFE